MTRYFAFDITMMSFTFQFKKKKSKFIERGLMSQRSAHKKFPFSDNVLVRTSFDNVLVSEKKEQELY